jgi:NADPH:quinone reductase-like Zn-dependent oxidoreductase
LVVNQRYVRKVPENVSLEMAAALPFSYLTAYMLLFRMGSLMTGDTVLVHNAGGAVGTAVVTLARMKGAKVLATASRSKHERVRDLGAQLVIDYNNEDFVAEVQRATGGRGVELVLDAGGPTRFMRSYQVLAPLGKLVMYGVQSSVSGNKGLMDFFGLAWRGWRLKFRPTELMNLNRGVLGLNIGHLWDFPEQAGFALDELVTWLGEEKFTPEIDRTFTYVRAGEAHSYVEGNQNFGKVLLDFTALTPGAPQTASQV